MVLASHFSCPERASSSANSSSAAIHKAADCIVCRPISVAAVVNSTEILPTLSKLIGYIIDIIESDRGDRYDAFSIRSITASSLQEKQYPLALLTD